MKRPGTKFKARPESVLWQKKAPSAKQDAKTPFQNHLEAQKKLHEKEQPPELKESETKLRKSAHDYNNSINALNRAVTNQQTDADKKEIGALLGRHFPTQEKQQLILSTMNQQLMLSRVDFNELINTSLEQLYQRFYTTVLPGMAGIALTEILEIPDTPQFEVEKPDLVRLSVGDIQRNKGFRLSADLTNRLAVGLAISDEYLEGELSGDLGFISYFLSADFREKIINRVGLLKETLWGEFKLSFEKMRKGMTGEFVMQYSRNDDSEKQYKKKQLEEKVRAGKKLSESEEKDLLELRKEELEEKERRFKIQEAIRKLEEEEEAGSLTINETEQLQKLRKKREEFVKRETNIRLEIDKEGKKIIVKIDHDLPVGKLKLELGQTSVEGIRVFLGLINRKKGYFTVELEKGKNNPVIPRLDRETIDWIIEMIQSGEATTTDLEEAVKEGMIGDADLDLFAKAGAITETQLKSIKGSQGRAKTGSYVKLGAGVNVDEENERELIDISLTKALDDPAFQISARYSSPVFNSALRYQYAEDETRLEFRNSVALVNIAKMLNLRLGLNMLIPLSTRETVTVQQEALEGTESFDPPKTVRADLDPIVFSPTLGVELTPSKNVRIKVGAAVEFNAGKTPELTSFEIQTVVDVIF
jgi:hypothetical protein